jgi:superoxide dismutase, Cu-Zn family
VRTDLRDLHPLSAGPLDQAWARVQLLTYKGTSTVTLRVRDIDPAVAGHTFGAHLHAGPCVAGDGAAAGPHYNADVVAGRVPATVSAQTEVWLDFTVSRTGSGSARAVVPFVPRPGNRSIVIHQDPTDHHGVAGPRVACVPLSW